MVETSPVGKMLERYQCRNNEERREALKEIVQEITLVALGRADFFSRAAFYGGTALRIFHGLERFSEDLDFSLEKPDRSFDLAMYLPAVRDELGAYGFEMDVDQKQKTEYRAVQSAFIKGGTLIHLVKLASIIPPVSGVAANEQLKIKFEVDTDPPTGATYEVKYRLSPIAHSVRLYDPPSLFAGKLHAILCRDWEHRVKGRDFYDYVWYLSHNIQLNIAHLESRMRQTGHWSGDRELDREELLRLLEDRFSTLDFKQAKYDVLPFIKDSRVLDLWSKEFFIAITIEKLHVR